MSGIAKGLKDVLALVELCSVSANVESDDFCHYDGKDPYKNQVAMLV